MNENVKQIFNLGRFYLLGSIFQKALPFVFLPIYTNYLTPQDYGILSLLGVMVTWMERVVAAPVGNGITRHFHDPEVKSFQGEMIFSGWMFTLVQSLIASLVFFFFSKELSQLVLGDSSFSLYVKLFAFVMLASPMSTLMFSLLRIQGKAKLFVVSNLVVFSLSAILQVVLLVYYEMGILAMVYGTLFVSWCNLLIVTPFIIPSLRFRMNRMALKVILQFGYPLIIGALVAVLTKSLDRLVLNYYHGLAAVGLLAIGFKIASIMEIVVSNPLKQTLLPIIYKMENDPSAQKNFVRRTTTYLWIGVLFVGLGLSLFAREIVLIMTTNPEFLAAWTVVPILVLATSNEAMTNLFGYGMAMAKKSFLISVTSIYVLIVNVALLAALVPFLGLLGAGVALAASTLARNVIRAYYSKKYYGQTFETTRLVILLVLGFSLWLLGLLFLETNLWFSIPIRLTLLILFPTIIWFSPFLAKEDKIKLKEASSNFRKRGLIKSLQKV